MNSNVQSGESDLIAAILAGDTQLYHQLIRPYERRVYTMSLSYMKNDKDAEFVTEATFVRALRDLGAFRGDCKFGIWLICIAINEANSRLQRQTANRIASLEELPCEEVPVPQVPPYDWRELPSNVVEREEIRRLLQKTIAMLPDVYQRVLLLRHVEGLDVNDTARILAIDGPLVRAILHRARIMLQSLLVPGLRQ